MDCLSKPLLIFCQAFSCSCVQLKCVPFRVRLLNGSVMVAKLGMNWELYVAIPSNDLTSLTEVGVGVSINASIFFGSGRVPSFKNISPKNSKLSFRNLHFPKFKVKPFCSSLSRHWASASSCLLTLSAVGAETVLHWHLYHS